MTKGGEIPQAAWRRLIAAARRVRRSAYASYSGFPVGAALLDDRGRVHAGCNVENASYGLTVCAERSAVFAAVASGARRFRALVLAAPGREPAAPCGACLQVLAEFAPDLPILMVAASGRTSRHAVLSALLPHGFRLDRR